jgi:proteasome lid subunit RPN8/RPN11
MKPLSPDQIAQMAAHITACLPEEACGMIGGAHGEARLIIPVTNSLHSPVRFRMDPSEQLQAFLRFEAEELDLLAIFHSHPAGPAAPSETDRAEHAYPGVLCVILSPGPGGWQAGIFDLDR